MLLADLEMIYSMINALKGEMIRDEEKAVTWYESGSVCLLFVQER